MTSQAIKQAIPMAVISIAGFTALITGDLSNGAFVLLIALAVYLCFFWKGD